MRKSLLCAAFATAFMGLGMGLSAAAPSAMQKPDRPSVENLAQPVVCVGDRRNYANFNHCWAYRGTRHRRANYCSRICGTGYVK
jgi:hypothetical protein